MAKKQNTGATFTKEQLYTSKKYEMQRDLIGILLEEDKEYTFEEVDNKIKEFMQREVK